MSQMQSKGHLRFSVIFDLMFWGNTCAEGSGHRSVDSLWSQGVSCKNVTGREFPGGPGVRTVRFRCQGCWFNSWLGTKILQAVQPQKSKLSRISCGSACGGDETVQRMVSRG